MMPRTSLVPEGMPIKAPTKQSELFLGFEREIRSRRDSLLVQPVATLESDPKTWSGLPKSEGLPLLHLPSMK